MNASGQNKANYKRMLTAIDLGPSSQVVMRRSVGLAERLNANLDLVHIHEGLPAYATDALLQSTLSQVSETLRAHALDYLKSLQAGASRVKDVHVFFGKPCEKIYDTARSIDADMVCIGSHRSHGMGMLVPDRCNQILHHADRDVLVMKTGKNGGEQEAGYGHVLIAVDFSEASAPTLRHGVALARACGSRITLIHVIDHFPVDRSNELIAPEDQDPLKYEEQRTEITLSDLAQGIGLEGCDIRELVSEGTAKREIPGFAEGNAVDLIVVGSHGRHGMDALIGSVAIGVVHRAQCDVLVVRAAGGGAVGQ